MGKILLKIDKILFKMGKMLLKTILFVDIIKCIGIVYIYFIIYQHWVFRIKNCFLLGR